jgi:hypothetical protein
MPEKSGDGWDAAPALRMEVESWEACEAYSNHLRRQCDPRVETPLDDRLKGVYGRLHVQAMKVAMICAALDWMETGQSMPPAVSARHWQTGRAIAEHWRASAHRLLDHLDRSGAARSERWMQDRIRAAASHRLPAPQPQGQRRPPGGRGPGSSGASSASERDERRELCHRGGKWSCEYK